MDLNLIFDCADKAVECAVNGLSGVIGWDEDNNNVLSCNIMYVSNFIDLM